MDEIVSNLLATCDRKQICVLRPRFGLQTIHNLPRRFIENVLLWQLSSKNAYFVLKSCYRRNICSFRTVKKLILVSKRLISHEIIKKERKMNRSCSFCCHQFWRASSPRVVTAALSGWRHTTPRTASTAQTLWVKLWYGCQYHASDIFGSDARARSARVHYSQI